MNKRAFSAKQNDRPLSIYYGELTEIFSELDHRDKVVMVDETDIASYQKLLQRQREHIFLVGLKGDFEQVRGEILRKDPIPKLEECYALVHRDDVRRGSKKASTAAIVETKTEEDSGEKSSALAAAAGDGGKVLNISTPVLIVHG